jgi:hypothetical protein
MPAVSRENDSLLRLSKILSEDGGKKPIFFSGFDSLFFTITCVSKLSGYGNYG